MRTERDALFAFLGGAAALVGLAGCPGTLEDPERFQIDASEAGAPAVAGSAGTAGSAGSAGSAGQTGQAGSDACGDVPARIFVPTCGGTGCHSVKAPQQGLDLVSPDVASRIVGETAKTCLSILADPANPEGSLMYQKLLPKPACGVQMPLARPPLSAADVACVRAWIAAQTP